MKRKDLLNEIGSKLKQIRDTLKYSRPAMAYKMGVVRSSYLRNENGVTCPDIRTMHLLGNNFNISLDWLICNKGSMYYRGPGKTPEMVKPPEKPLAPPTPVDPVIEKKPAPAVLDTLPVEIQELLDHMTAVPLLRYEILASFHRFKEEHQEMVAAAMMDLQDLETGKLANKK